MSRPNIAQLEQILDNEEEVELEILPRTVKSGPKGRPLYWKLLGANR
jgi:hypothetical protein